MIPLFAMLIAAEPRLLPVTAPTKVGAMIEWGVEGLPTPERPFDDREWRLEAIIQRPGRPAARVEAFWFAPYRDRLSPEKKVEFTRTGAPGWRLRFTPMNPGPHSVRLSVRHRGQTIGRVGAEFRVAPGKLDGFVRVSGENPEYLATAGGERFIPIGWNTAWWNDGGLQDYERWADAMQRGGMNYARLWMAPWCFGIEQDAGTLGNYSLDRAWALDHVLEIFRKRGIHVVLCLDYHGMLQPTKDFWGSNDNWRINPYNAANGGPAKTQNDFFISEEARRLYRQRLRYVVNRYAAFSNVAVWEFWNEIDNVRQHFNEADMIAWHRDMARTVRGMDPYGRLVSTSLIHDGYPTLWSNANLDLTQSHSYNQANPGLEFAERARRFRETYRRPYLVGEYGVDFRAPMREADPKDRGPKQALWGSLVGGGAGAAQSWWWETLHVQNVYPMFRSLRDFVDGSPLGSKGWRPLVTANLEEPTELPPAAEPAVPFDVRLNLVPAWGDRNRGILLLTDPVGAGSQSANLNGYLHGTGKPDLQRPFRLTGHFGAGARLSYHLNSVSAGAEIVISVDGREVVRRTFRDRDGKWEINGEFNETVTLEVPPGTHTLELKNVGPDWAAIDWVEVTGARTTRPLAEGGIPVRSVASGHDRAATVWVLDPAYSYPANSRIADAREVTGAWTEVLGLRDGIYRVRWWDTSAGRWLKTERGDSRRGRLRLTVPAFREDIAALIDEGGGR